MTDDADDDEQVAFVVHAGNLYPYDPDLVGKPHGMKIEGDEDERGPEEGRFEWPTLPYPIAQSRIGVGRDRVR